MPQLPNHPADPDNTATWAKYSAKLCHHCAACCCGLPVEVKTGDLVRMGLVDAFLSDDDPKFLARRLIKDRLVDHFHGRTATFTLARRASGDCIFLDPRTRRCTVYGRRPETCRNHPHIGPRPGYCPFRAKNPD
jgi:hypothetical protein